ncbi:MAG: hypothetical protein AB1782_09225 [Cyanobacteriota bacterium]
MSQIESLMKELNLGDDIIQSTVNKINTICLKNSEFNIFGGHALLSMLGNGDGNGSY